MKEPTSRKVDAHAKRGVKRLRVRRPGEAHRAARARRAPRWLRVCGWSAGGTFGLAIAASLVIYALFMTGIITVDMARPYVERALEARLGPGQTVQIGAITAERASDGGMLLQASNIVVRDPAGEVIALAPQAEVEMQNSLLPWIMRPRRVDLVGVKVTVVIDKDGAVAISTEGGRPLGAAPGKTTLPPPSPEVAAGKPAGDTASETARQTAGGPLRFAALAAIADGIDRGGFDGGVLDQIGLKDGTLLVRSEISGRQWTFDDIDISVSRPAEGGVAFDLGSGGTGGRWSARATVGGLADGQRAVALRLRDLSPRDLLIAAGKADADLVATSPLSLDIAAHIDAAGTLLSSEGRAVIGAGDVQLGTDKASRFRLDEASVAFHFDPALHVINLQPVSIKAGPFATQIVAVVNGSTDDGVWRIKIDSATANFAGGGPYAEKEPPFVLDNVALEGQIDLANRRFTVLPGTLKGPQGGMTLGLVLDLGAADPFFSLTANMTSLPVNALKRMWPITAAPDVRKWVGEHVIAGDVTKADIALNMPLRAIGNPQIKLPPESIAINIQGTGARLQPVPELPAIRGADVAVRVDARSTHVTATNGTVDTPEGRHMNLSNVVFDVPETAMLFPPAKVVVSLDGPASAAVELASMPPLRGVSNEQIDPESVHGTLTGTAQVNIKLSDHITPADVDYAFDADLTNFTADKVFLGQTLDDASVRAFMTPAATVLRGEGKIGGAPASFEFTRPKTGDPTFVLAATLDDAARTKLNLELAGVSGSIGVKLTGTIGPKSRVADVDVDLTGARLAELVPGWSKPPGRPARLTAKASSTSNGTKFENLVISGQGVDIRGTLELDAKAGLVSAYLPTFQLSDGDKASVKADNSDGVLRLTVRGEIIEARAFLKNLLQAPIAGRKNDKPFDVDLDVNLDVVVGNSGETLRNAVLKLSRRGGNLTAFSLGALVGRGGAVNGDLIANGGQPRLRVATSDAGALLRFVNLYPRIYGGDLWLDVDAPRGDGAPQAGVINMRDFVIRGEPGLDRLIAAAPARGDGRPSPGSAIAFQKLQVEFTRTAEQLDIRDGAIWGPAIGSTFDGNLDFANDRISVRGTYVPAYGLNNLFSRLPVLGFLLGGGPNEGLVGVTYEVVGPLNGPTLRVNPISAVAPGFLRKIFEFRQAPDPTPPALVPVPTR